MALQATQRIRIASLLGFVAIMPILAIPAVNRRVDGWLFASNVEPLEERLERMREEADTAGVSLGRRRGASERAGEVGAIPLTSTQSTSTQSTSTQSGAKRPRAVRSASGSRPALAMVPAEHPVSRLPPVDSEIDAERFEYLQRRLQSLGAIYYRLEELGESPNRYRFRCEVPLPGNDVYLRPFEVEDNDPLQAMQRALDDVEVWTAAQRMRSANIRQ